ncbi:P-loop NTPase fold protein [uncultured Nonlabens sp.]|uniref:KAP family P-loop NTPase fold protein n=1 Tax=uncultured Nonlabens sp. TaxID=859306 RepID=UPI0026268984|nr:P-loop NTPase fold protein [uncultured Nonlabens sp.]
MSIPRLNTSFQPAKEDLLNFKPYAQKVQNIIRGLSNTSESIVIGIDGEWGSGKSTFSNMVFKHLEMFSKGNTDRRIIKMRYNPWMYSGTDEMLFDFLNEMKKSFYRSETNAKKIGKGILKYSKYLKSVKISGKIGLSEIASIGVSVEPEKILREIGGELIKADEGLIDLKENINKLLEESDIKLVVFIDDLDRLDKDELFTILKMIKLTADFNHVVFVVCLDSEMISKSIYQRYGNDKEDGKKFLEKIINVPISLPLIEDIDRKEFLVKLLNKTFDQYQFVDLAEKNQLLQSLHLVEFNNPREAIRVTNSFTYSLFAIGDEVNVHDLFWIEYIKIKNFRLYKELKDYGLSLRTNLFFENRVILNNRNDLTSAGDTNRDKLMKRFDADKRIINMLFPVDNRGTTAYLSNAKQEPETKINREKRISHADHYEKYFSYHTERKVSFLWLNQLILSINENQMEAAVLTFDKLKEKADDIRILRMLIESMRQPNEIGVVPVALLNFLEHYKEDCALDGDMNISIEAITPELVAGITTDHKKHLEILKRLCINTNLNTSLSIGSLIASSISEDEAAKCFEIIKIRIISFEEQAYFELLSSNPYYFHQYWRNSEKDEFYDYLSQRLNTEEQIGHFLKLFVNFWNGEIRGMIRKENYKAITDLVNRRLIWVKINEVFEDIEKPKNLESYSDRDSNSFRQLAEQFLYWVPDATKASDF